MATKAAQPDCSGEQSLKADTSIAGLGVSVLLYLKMTNNANSSDPSILCYLFRPGMVFNAVLLPPTAPEDARQSTQQPLEAILVSTVPASRRAL